MDIQIHYQYGKPFRTKTGCEWCMSRLLGILGRAITVDTADLIWHWLNVSGFPVENDQSPRYRQMQKTIELMGEMKLDAATEHLRMYLFENPSCTHGRLAAAAICLHNNQLYEAIKELNSVYMRQPNNTMTLYVLGHCYERLGKESQAVEFYQDCLKFKNYLQLPAQRLAAIYFKNGQLEKTMQQYELVTSEYPDDISSLITLGYLYILTGRFMQAIETFNRAILIHPDNFQNQDDNIDQLIAEGEFYEALERIEDLLQAQPEKPDLLMKYADVLRMIGATSDAVSRYEDALRVCPDFLEATIKLGTQYLQMEQEHLAARQFNKAVEINDNIVEAYVGLAIAQKASGNVKDALGTLYLAAAIQPNSSLLFNETATLRFKAGLKEHHPFNIKDDYDSLSEAVIVAHRQQINHHPYNPDLHYRLGLLLMNDDRVADAIESFQTALEINPDYTRAQSKLAICLLETDRKTEAIDIISCCECLDKDTLNLHYQTALLYCDRVKFASSLINLEQHLVKNFACPDATVNISIVLQNLGLLDRTTAMWDNLTDMADQVMNTENLF
jgi:tetratricopeptide (TPR) repeat protein